MIFYRTITGELGFIIQDINNNVVIDMSNDTDNLNIISDINNINYKSSIGLDGEYNDNIKIELINLIITGIYNNKDDINLDLEKKVEYFKIELMDKIIKRISKILSSKYNLTLSNKPNVNILFHFNSINDEIKYILDEKYKNIMNFELSYNGLDYGIKEDLEQVQTYIKLALYNSLLIGDIKVELAREDVEKALNILYLLERKLDYECKNISSIINYLQNNDMLSALYVIDLIRVSGEL